VIGIVPCLAGAHDSSSSLTPGRRLCFAFLCAGRATSSGFAWDNGCPGGATGLRMLSNTGLACALFVFGGELRLAISASTRILRNAAMLSPQRERCQ
jgi:hypothetical protein